MTPRPPRLPTANAVPYRSLTWSSDTDPAVFLADAAAHRSAQRVLILRFTGATQGESTPWQRFEAFTRSRAVTVADIACDLPVPALEVALCCDLVVARVGTILRLPEPADPPTAGLVWAAGRAGRAALRCTLLGGGQLELDEAVRVGLVHRVVAADAELPIPASASLPAWTAARDLLRSDDLRARPALELATFRYLFACGHPEEGAQAFLDRRDPDFR